VPAVIGVVYPTSGAFDAIEQHARGLAQELARRGLHAEYLPGGGRALARAARADHAEVVIVEYMPFAYGRWGFAPDLVLAAAFARRAGAPRLLLMVHEVAVAPDRVSARLMSLWQRVQLRSLVRLADEVLAATEANVVRIQPLTHPRAVLHAPSPSNIPRSSLDRAAARAALGVEPSETVVAIFGGRHPSRARGHIEAALSALAPDGPVTLLNLGAEAPAIAVPIGVREERPGELAPMAIADHLAAADLYLAPFSDGASARRTTVAAALQHGLPVVGTRGAQTDAVLRTPDGPCVLVAFDDIAGYAEACRSLARNPEEREQRGRAATALYESVFSWRAVGDTFAAAIETALHRADRADEPK
jgi:glycosyltransferase involved in cell wall biosynthesis